MVEIIPGDKVKINTVKEEIEGIHKSQPYYRIWIHWDYASYIDTFMDTFFISERVFLDQEHSLLYHPRLLSR